MSTERAEVLMGTLSSFGRTLQALARGRENSLSASRVVALRHLRTGPLRVSELGSRLGVNASVVTRVVQSLESDGLVGRAPDPGDARASLISTTTQGLQLLVRNETEASERAQVALADWTDTEAAAAIAVLQRLEFAIKEFGQPGGNDGATALQEQLTTTVATTTTNERGL